ncbi:hypothetical protein [Streptomyces sp. JS01]|nr:hypothetical protein [Streptomyces sp. JS01]
MPNSQDRARKAIEAAFGPAAEDDDGDGGDDGDDGDDGTVPIAV